MTSFLFFSRNHPALLSSIYFLLGLSFIKDLNISFLIPTVLLLIPFLWNAPQKAIFLSFVFLSACFYGHLNKPTFPPLQSQLHGIALFIPSEMKTFTTHFKKNISVKGIVQVMSSPSGQIAKKVPCSFILPNKLKPAIFNSSYYIQGTLEKSKQDSSYFSFKPDADVPWKNVSYSFSLVEWRFHMKTFLSKKIHSLFSDEAVADFISGVTLGIYEGRMLKYDFSRLGLQHILAISGFHFGLIALLLGSFFQLVMKEKAAHIALFLFLTIYFLLLGPSPSVLRAYLAISLYLVAKLARLKPNSLNLLGVVLFLEILISPQVISHLGFQLSFLATFSILFLLPLTKKWTLWIFPYRDEEKALALHPFDRWGYLICCTLRSTFALSLAVNLATTPVCLFYFHKFPLISLIYNLFIPFAFSISLFLLFASFPLFLIIPKAFFLITSLNEKFTARVLQIIAESPPCFDLYLRVPPFPLPLLLLLLLMIFSLPFLKILQKKSQFSMI